MAAVTRAGLIKSWTPFARPFRAIGDWFGNCGSGSGGMHMRLSGLHANATPLTLAWNLTAQQNHGPKIPIIPATILARRLALSTDITPGARACMGEITLEDFTEEIAELDVSWTCEQNTTS